MKKSLTQFTFLCSIAIAIIAGGCDANKLGNGVATVGNNNNVVTLFHNSADVKFQENGQDLELVKAYVAHKKPGYAAYSAGSGGYDYYSKGIQLDKSVASHSITIVKGDKKVTVAITNKSKPYLDVTAELGETPMMSWADLQTEFLKQYSKKKKG